MNRIGILEPTTLLGSEVRERVGDRPDLFSHVDLLSADQTVIGTLTDVGGAAAMVTAATPEAVSELDWIVVCSQSWREAQPVLEAAQAAPRALVMSPDAPSSLGPMVVAGINAEVMRSEDLVRAAPAAVVLLAKVVAPMIEFGLHEVIATVLEPVSIRGQPGIDELFEQTKALLAFQQPVHSLFPHQVAFNLGRAAPSAEDADPWSAAASLREVLSSRLEALAAEDLAIAVERLQAGLFHSIAATVHFALPADVPRGDVLEALENAAIELALDEAMDEGPITALSAAGRDAIVVGSVAEPSDRSLSLWAVMDNLTVGGALHAIALLEEAG